MLLPWHCHVITFAVPWATWPCHAAGYTMAMSWTFIGRHSIVVNFHGTPWQCHEPSWVAKAMGRHKHIPLCVTAIAWQPMAMPWTVIMHLHVINCRGLPCIVISSSVATLELPWGSTMAIYLVYFMACRQITWREPQWRTKKKPWHPHGRAIKHHKPCSWDGMKCHMSRQAIPWRTVANSAVTRHPNVKQLRVPPWSWIYRTFLVC